MARTKAKGNQVNRALNILTALVFAAILTALVVNAAQAQDAGYGGANPSPTRTNAQCKALATGYADPGGDDIEWAMAYTGCDQVYSPGGFFIGWGRDTGLCGQAAWRGFHRYGFRDARFHGFMARTGCTTLFEDGSWTF